MSQGLEVGMQPASTDLAQSRKSSDKEGPAVEGYKCQTIKGNPHGKA